jgi:hypothetical protein
MENGSAATAAMSGEDPHDAANIDGRQRVFEASSLSLVKSFSSLGTRMSSKSRSKVGQSPG